MAITESNVSQVRLTAGPGGRVTIPAPLRRAAGIEPGEQLVASVEDGRVILEQWDHLLRRVQARVADATGHHPNLASEELIAERRAEAGRDDATSNATVDGEA